MKTLHLTLKRKWFDMIASGEKKEEYREIKRYWNQRFIEYFDMDGAVFEYFDQIIFRNGYQKDAPTITVQCLGIDIGEANPEWSDNWQGDIFRIKLGEIINKQ